MTIARHCNGGPHGEGWCGVPATHVARDEHGLEWFCCQAHAEGAGQRASTRLVALALATEQAIEWERVAPSLVAPLRTFLDTIMEVRTAHAARVGWLPAQVGYLVVEWPRGSASKENV